MSTSAEDLDPVVSVVMPVWNPDPGQLREALASVLGQTLGEFELIVVADPGPVAAGGVVREVGDRRVRLVCNAARTSMAAARNQGIGLARADLVAMLDADDACEPDRLERQVAFLDRHPDVDVVGSALKVVDEEGRTKGERVYPTAHDAIVAAMRCYNPLAHPTVMFRRRVVEAHGGYGTGTGPLCEDYDLWSRLARSGVRFANLPEPLVRYRLHGGATKARRLKETLRATLRIKRTYWGDSLGRRDRLRMWGERLLLLLPPTWVMGLFVRWTLRRGGRTLEAR